MIRKCQSVQAYTILVSQPNPTRAARVLTAAPRLLARIRYLFCRHFNHFGHARYLKECRLGRNHILPATDVIHHADHPSST
jgi:hypothetical protein